MFARPVGPDAELRPLEVWHAEEFADHLDRAREHIRPWVGPSFVTRTEDAARATLRRYAEAAAADTGRLFGIWLDGTLVGGVMFVTFDAAGGTCELGCWLEPAAEGRGLVTAAATVLLDWALHERGLHRAEWRCRSDNARSAAVARRLGMTLEGVLRGAWLNAGVHHDKQVWAVLREERFADRPSITGASAG
jgi:ribosomal-protein-serine acetyltransferase